MMIPDWKLEKYLTGDLPAEEMREIREMEATDEIFAGRVKMLREDNAAILKKLPFEKLSEKIAMMPGRSNAGAGNTVRVNFKLVKLAAAAALVLAVVTVALFGQRSLSEQNTQLMEVAMVDASSDDGLRIKGLSARMEVWKKTGDSAVQMENLGEAREGDEIQLRYAVAEKCFGLLFSMDGNGTITMHMGRENRAVELEPGKMTTLPFAYKLDNAPKFEKFFFLTSKSEFELNAGDIDASLKQEGVKAVSLTLRKTEGK
ncbi:MAG: hypothetical protein IKB43_08820 [Fibrobacter sp.]|nr:hypothetical protein [Fibrobacter sp.]MBR2470235.1 hypothetical protein [Fibrobacter sp.]